jgi:hypothetical protein
MPDAPEVKPDETPDAKPDTASTTPPWGDEFDAARAWDTITAQRAAEQELKARIAALETAAESLVPKADLDAAIARADAAEASVKTAKRDAALASSGLPEELHAFVTAEDDEGIAEQVAKLTAAIKPAEPAKPAATEPTEPAKPAPLRPAAALTPGHGGDEAPVFDADALVASIRG